MSGSTRGEIYVGGGWKEGGNFFSHFSGGNKKGGQLTFYSIFSGRGKSMLAAMYKLRNRAAMGINADWVEVYLNPIYWSYKQRLSFTAKNKRVSWIVLVRKLNYIFLSKTGYLWIFAIVKFTVLIFVFKLFLVLRFSSFSYSELDID